MATYANCWCCGEELKQLAFLTDPHAICPECQDVFVEIGAEIKATLHEATA